MLIHGHQKDYLLISDEKISSVSRFTRPFIEYTNARINLKIIAIANYYTVYRLNPRTNSSDI